jgi:hypothetical protein
VQQGRAQGGARLGGARGRRARVRRVTRRAPLTLPRALSPTAPQQVGLKCAAAFARGDLSACRMYEALRRALAARRARALASIVSADALLGGVAQAVAAREAVRLVEVANAALDALAADLPLARVDAIMRENRAAREGVAAVNALLGGDADVDAVRDEDLEREWGAAGGGSAAVAAAVAAPRAAPAPAPAPAAAQRAPAAAPAAAAEADAEEEAVVERVAIPA